MNPPDKKCPACGADLVAAGPAGWCAACLLDTGAADDAPLEEWLWAGRYRLLEPLGQGGFATVWRAEQTEPVRRTVALKVLDAGLATPRILARFEGERQALARMAHPGIAAVYDAGTHDGQAFIVMELVEGKPVTAFCQEHGTSLRGRLELFAGICDAVQHAHGRGVIHRDLKPSNLLAAQHDSATVVKVIDFGVARALEEPLAAEAVTVWRQMIGTPGYISPEQWQFGSAAAEARSDVYALGVVLYELLAGRAPHAPREGEAPEAFLRRASVEDAPPLRGLLLDKTTGTARRELDAITARAMARDPAQRYATAAALADEVRRFLQGEPVEAMRRGARYLLGTLYRRHRAAVLAAAAILTAVIAGGAVSAVQYFKAEQARGVAAAERSRAESSEANMRIALAAANVAAARQLVLQGQPAAALPHMARAVQLAPDNAAAAADLLLLLPQAPLLRSEARWPGIAAELAVATSHDVAAAATETTLTFLRAGEKEASVKLPARAVAMAGSETGSVIAVALADRRLLVFANGAAAPPQTWACDDAITTVAISPHGATVAVGTGTGAVWSWRTGATPQLVTRGQGAVSHLIISGADDAPIVAGFDSGEIRRGGVVLVTLTAAVTALEVARDGNFIAAGSADGKVFIRQGGQTAEWRGAVHRGRVTGIAMAPDGQSVVTAGAEPELHVWHPPASTESTPPVALNGPAVRLAIPRSQPDSVLIYHEDGAVRSWPLRGGPLLPLALSRGRNALLAVSRDGSAALLHDPAGQGLQLLQLRGAALPSALLSGADAGITALDWNGSALFAADSSGTLWRWDAATLDETHTSIAPAAKPLALRSLDPNVAAVACADGSCWRWQTGSAPQRTVPPRLLDGAAWDTAALSADVAAFARAPGEGDPFQPATGYLLADLKAGTSTPLGTSPPSQALALDSRSALASGWRDGRIRIAPRGSRQGQRLDRHTAAVTALTFSANDAQLLSGDAAGTLLLCQLPVPQPLAELPAAISAVAISRDGTRAAAACDSRVFLFDTATRQGLGLPLDAGHPVTSLALDEHGASLAAGTSRGAIRLWHLSPPGSTAPAWLAPFAEAWSAQHLLASGQRETLRDAAPVASFRVAAEATRHTHPAATALYEWLTAPPSRRTFAPWAPWSGADYLQHIGHRPGPAQHAESRRLGPATREDEE